MIRFGTEGRSEGRRLGYLCLQQQHVEVGDRLSVDAQELQFTSQSVCQLSDLKLPGRKGRVKNRPRVASPGGCGPRGSRPSPANRTRDGPWPLSQAGLGHATLNACTCHPLYLLRPREGVGVGQQDETSSTAAGGASEPQLLCGDPALLPAPLSAVTPPNQPKEGYGLGLLQHPGSGVTAEQSPGQKVLNTTLRPFPKGNSQDIISGFISCRFPEEQSGKRSRGVTALDLLPSRDSVYVKAQASPQRPPLLNPSVPQGPNLQFGCCTGTRGPPVSIPLTEGTA